MMTPKSNLIKVKEVCSVCTKYILIGHSASVWRHCDVSFHTKCAKKATFKLFRNKQYCLSCITTNNIIRYNPFHDKLENQDDKFFENEPTEHIQSIQELSKTLENCKSYSKSQFNELMANDLNQKHQGQAQNLLLSTYFLNIDGNKTNFETRQILSPELAVIKHKFSVVALAETNTDECHKDLYKLSNEYTPVISIFIKN